MAKSTTKRAFPFILTAFCLLWIMRALFPDFFIGLGEGFTDGLR